MTAAHQPRALEAVPDTEELAPDLGDWRAQSVIDQYSPEHQLVGSLLWLDIDEARCLLELVPDTAIWRPHTRWAYELIRRVVDNGDTPTPPAVLALGRRQAANDAIEPGQPPTDERYRQLSLYLFDAYAQAIAPNGAWRTYAREVLDEAYRRAFDTCGIRMQQLAASGLDRAELTKQFSAIRDELADLWRRAAGGQHRIALDEEQGMNDL